MYVQQQLSGIQVSDMNMYLRNVLIVGDGTSDSKRKVGADHCIIEGLSNSYCGRFTIIVSRTGFSAGNGQDE